MEQQEIFKKLHFEKEDIKAAGRYFKVMKPRTCRNCYFYDFCMFPQKLNPNYRVNDFKTPQNRYELMPDGYCVPVKYNSISPEDYYPGYRVHIEIDEILNSYKLK